jgi:Mce-associated membrane protein
VPVKPSQQPDTAESAEVTDAAEAAEVSEDTAVSEDSAVSEAAEVSEDTAVSDDTEAEEATEASEDAAETEAPQTPEQRHRAELRERQDRRREAREERERRRRRLMLLPVALGVVTVALGGLAAWFGLEAHNVTSTPTARNTAVTDAAATSAVRSQMTSAVSALFTYNYAHPARTTQAVHGLLTGAATAQYSSLFGQVSEAPASDKVVVSTTVTRVGVESLTGDQARVLVFAEIKQSESGAAAQSGAVTLAVNAVRQGSTWKIDGITTY